MWPAPGTRGTLGGKGGGSEAQGAGSSGAPASWASQPARGARVTAKPGNPQGTPHGQTRQATGARVPGGGMDALRSAQRVTRHAWQRGAASRGRRWVGCGWERGAWPAGRQG